MPLSPAFNPSAYPGSPSARSEWRASNAIAPRAEGGAGVSPGKGRRSPRGFPAEASTGREVGRGVAQVRNPAVVWEAGAGSSEHWGATRGPRQRNDTTWLPSAKAAGS